MRDHTGRSQFVILTSPRCGSTWLVSLLNQVDGISAFGELFLTRKRAPGQHRWDADFAYPRFVEVEQKAHRLRPLAVFSYLDEFFNRPGVVGFKLMYSQIHGFPELLAYFMAHRTRVIHLFRKNSLDQLISLEVRSKLEQSHQLVGQEVAENVQVELNTKTLVHNLELRQQMISKTRKRLSLTGLPVCEITYEDLQKGPDTFQRICVFLSIPYLENPPTSKYVKIRRGSQAEVLSNYEEVCKTLAGTPFLVFLD